MCLGSQPQTQISTATLGLILVATDVAHRAIEQQFGGVFVVVRIQECLEWDGRLPVQKRILDIRPLFVEFTERPSGELD